MEVGEVLWIRRTTKRMVALTRQSVVQMVRQSQESWLPWLTKAMMKRLVVEDPMQTTLATRDLKASRRISGLTQLRGATGEGSARRRG